jgi:NAD(P)H dehydrogenase (quinone)
VEIMVLFDSKTGNVYGLAKAIAEGMREVEGVNVRMRRVKETTPMEIVRANEARSAFYDAVTKEIPEATAQDMEETEVVAIGSPTRYGNASAAMSNFIESLGELWMRGALVGKVAGVFCSTGTMHGGNEATLLSMMLPLMHLGYIITPMGYSDIGVMQTQAGGTPYGPSSVSGNQPAHPLDKNELQIARAFGKRLAETTKKLRS